MLVLSWSGGKDSALTLHELRASSGLGADALITTVTHDHGRVSMHGVRRELLARQAEEIGLPLVEVEIPAVCSNEVYEQRMGHALARAPLSQARAIALPRYPVENMLDRLLMAYVLHQTGLQRALRRHC